MRLTHLRLQNFRNHKKFEHAFSNNLTILVGPNASGKTNLLEAIRFLSFSKSFRARKDLDLISWGENFVRVKGEIEKESDKTDLEVVIDTAKKTKSCKVIKINGQICKVSDLIGKLVTVFFAPEDLNLITLAPSVRRKYLDMVVAQLDKGYYRDLLELRQVLLNRNKLLFEIRERRAKPSELDFWNRQLITLAKKIFQKRMYLLNFYNSRLSGIFNQIVGKDEKLKIEYLPCPSFLKKAENIEEIFSKELEKQQEEEIKRCRSLIGPHRDDFLLELSGKNLAFFGSRGEARSAILALKLCELLFLKKKLFDRPILLLDDIFSELDVLHRVQVARVVKDQQTILTTTEFESIPKELVGQAEVLEL